MFCDVYRFRVVVNTICWNFGFHKEASNFLTGNVRLWTMDLVYFVGWLVGVFLGFFCGWLLSFVGCLWLVGL